MNSLRLILCMLVSMLPLVAMGQEPAAVDSVAVEAVRVDSIAGKSIPSDSVVAPVQRPPRKITPVDIDENKPVTTLHYYDKHGNALPEPVRFLATLDTVTKPKSKPVYPLFNGGSIGLNFGDAIFMACGQKHAGFDIWGDVSLYNWLFPVAEVGVGFADSTPEKGNFTYKGKPSIYAKVGFNYNFMYKSDPAYQLFVGFRAGYSNFRYNVENVTITDSYWQETQNISLTDLKAWAVYGEFVAGLKVKIVGNFSLGWNARYHLKFKVNSQSSSMPWYIPGYGTNSPFSFAVSAIYSFGQKKADAGADAE